MRFINPKPKVRNLLINQICVSLLLDQVFRVIECCVVASMTTGIVFAFSVSKLGIFCHFQPSKLLNCGSWWRNSTVQANTEWNQSDHKWGGTSRIELPQWYLQRFGNIVPGSSGRCNKVHFSTCLGNINSTWAFASICKCSTEIKQFYHSHLGPDVLIVKMNSTSCRTRWL